MVGTVLLGGAAALWIWGERGKLLQSSTLEGFKQMPLKAMVTGKGLHMYVYGRWTGFYINTLINGIYPRLGPQGKKWLSDRYHGKVITHDEARAIVQLDHDIPLTTLGERVIPYPIARDLLLQGPPEIAIFECPCRKANPNHCEPLEVCMVVGQPGVDFLLEHQPSVSRRINQAEALQILREEHERGHVHSAWFKDACMDRFYAICNCCACCCGGHIAMLRYDIPVMTSSGFVATVDGEICQGCESCVEACHFSAIRVEETAAVERDACLGCGVCVDVCPHGALVLERDESKGDPLDVCALISEPDHVLQDVASEK